MICPNGAEPILWTWLIVKWTDDSITDGGRPSFHMRRINNALFTGHVLRNDSWISTRGVVDDEYPVKQLQAIKYLLRFCCVTIFNPAAGMRAAYS